MIFFLQDDTILGLVDARLDISAMTWRIRHPQVRLNQAPNRIIEVNDKEPAIRWVEEPTWEGNKNHMYGKCKWTLEGWSGSSAETHSLQTLINQVPDTVWQTLRSLRRMADPFEALLPQATNTTSTEVFLPDIF